MKVIGLQMVPTQLQWDMNILRTSGLKHLKLWENNWHLNLCRANNSENWLCAKSHIVHTEGTAPSPLLVCAMF